MDLPARNSRSKERVLAIVVFGLFTVFGAAMTLALFVRPLLQVMVARSWLAVPCEIVASELRSRRDSEGDILYSVHIRYRYVIDGQCLESGRYDFLGGASTDRVRKEAIVARYQPGTTAICYVNPTQPAEAVLNRDFTPAMWVGLVPLTFAIVGLVGLSRLLAGAGCALSRLQQPQMPWRSRPDWAAGRIRSSSRSTMVAAWLGALVWNGIVWVLVLVAWDDVITSSHPAGWVLLLFVLVGVGLLAWAVYATLQWRKFGQATLELVTVPAQIGGRLQGRIRLREPVRPENGFELQLVCLRRRVTGSGKSRSIDEQVLWRGRQQTAGGMTDSIPVRFDIPADVPATNSVDPHDQILWRLEAHAKVPGVDFRAQFEVPVFDVRPGGE